MSSLLLRQYGGEKDDRMEGVWEEGRDGGGTLVKNSNKVWEN